MHWEHFWNELEIYLNIYLAEEILWKIWQFDISLIEGFKYLVLTFINAF